jgi:nitrogen fixation NifU-like protein
MAYSKEVIERFNNVLNNPEKFSVGRFDPSDSRVATGMVGAPSCGDVMRIQLLVEDNIIQDVKFKTYGCGSAIASSSKLVELLIGKTLQDAREVKDKDIANALQLPPIKIHCSVLAEDAIQKAIEDYEQRQQIQTS